jgi:hypothetical protein
MATAPRCARAPSVRTSPTIARRSSTRRARARPSRTRMTKERRVRSLSRSRPRQRAPRQTRCSRSRAPTRRAGAHTRASCWRARSDLTPPSTSPSRGSATAATSRRTTRCRSRCGWPRITCARAASRRRCGLLVAARGDIDTTCAIAGSVLALVDAPPASWCAAREPLEIELPRAR